MSRFLRALIPELGQQLVGGLRERGLAERLLFDSVNELFRRLDEQTSISQPSRPSPEFVAQARNKFREMPVQKIPEVSTLPTGSISGPPHYQYFVGRQDQLRTIAEALKSGEIAAIGQRQIVATTGLGGMGKTQLASEFVHRYGQYFLGGVYWLNFGEAAGIPNEVAQCGGPGRMGHYRSFYDLPLQDQVNAVWDAWQSDIPRLLVFDNCEDADLLSTWIPPTGGCRVLITSQSEIWDPTLHVVPLPLEVFSRDQSVALLIKHRSDLSADNRYLHDIAVELSDLPLAIDLAGRFMSRYDEQPEEYLEELRSEDLLNHESLANFTGISPTNHNMSVWRTFALSYRRLDRDNPVDHLAEKLLARAAYFAPSESIPIDSLIDALGLPEGDRQARRRAREGLNRLRGLGLLRTAESDSC